MFDFVIQSFYAEQVKHFSNNSNVFHSVKLMTNDEILKLTDRLIKESLNRIDEKTALQMIELSLEKGVCQYLENGVQMVLIANKA